MKIGGVDVTAPAEEMLVIPRGEKYLVFRAKPLTNLDEFDRLSPLPEPPGKLTKDGWVPDHTDPDYRTILQQYERRRLSYMLVKTLEPSNIEWDTVDINNPKTWNNWEDDLLKAGLTQLEVNRVTQLVIEANSLSEDKLKRARDLFQRGQAQLQAASSGRQGGPMSTPSGELAPESA